MRAKEFIVETAMMGKIADSGKIIRILKKAHTVPFSDEKNWLLVDTDPGKGNSGLGIKWIPADTRFEWVRPYRDTVEQGVAEEINPDILDPRFSHTQQIGDYTYIASVEIFLDEPILNIKAYDGDKEIGHVLFEIFDWEDDTSNSYMESGGTEVDPKYRGKGIATTMYAYAKMLGNDIIPSFNRTTQGKAMWAGWGQDAKHLRDVTEGQDDKAEAYRAHLIKTLPQIMKLFANIGKGWIPSKEQMLSAVDTAYRVMKHTGDVKQAGKVLMDELNTLYRMSQGKQDVAEGFSNAVTFFRGEPILSQERLNQLKSSIGKPYPILRKEGSAANIGTYMSPDGDKATSFVKQALAGQGKGGVVTQIQVNPNSFSKGDGGIDEAVIITNIAGLVSNQTPNKNDPLRIQDRKQAMLKYLGPGVKKYLNDPLLSDPKIVQSWYNPEFAQKNWNTINSGKQAVTKPGESNMQERMMRILGPLAENIRRDPQVINYFISHNPGDWVEYNFRMNSDGSGTKVVDVKYYPPAKQGVAEEMQHKKITELFDAKTAFPLKWDTQFASSGEVHAEAYDADGRIIDISFTPTGYGSGIEIVFKRGGSYDMTGHGDAPRVLATVVNAISQYLQKYQPPYIAFSAKSTGGRAGAYAAMIRRLARGYKLLTPDEYPDDTTGFLDFLGSDKPFILARS